MITIAYPHHTHKIKGEKGSELIFDPCRKRWFTLTPEEWVRQNFLQYLIQVMHYPASLIAVEKAIKIGDVNKRFDIVVNKSTRPWMIIECKETGVPLSETTITQILQYNISLQVQYLVVTNGNATFALQLDNGKFTWLDALPVY